MFHNNYKLCNYYTFSGVALYGIGCESQGIGLSISVDKDLMTWEPYSLSPVITTPTTINASYVGDPYIWKVRRYV